MAIVTTNTKTITGSATNTLGTLGRSVFNSTIGTFADKNTMDQIYGAMNNLNSSIETINKTVDFEALNGRNKPDDLFSLLAGLDIKSSSDFMNKNREFMKRLMRLNKQEKDITLDSLGVDVTGESDVIRNEYVREYEHVKGNNYIEDYVSTLAQNQQIGDETTTLQLESSTNFNYAGIHNDLYVVNQNLYPDDENRGSFANKWIVENRNSLLYKTKKLFNSNKVNTIISRFHTDPTKRPSLLDNAKSKYGLSHGRNLLTAQAENSLNTAYANGYDNPYCRVWTHHHQYDRYYKTIRPFSYVDDQGNYGDTLSVQEFHQWSQFSNDKDNTTKNQWGWKKEQNNGWQYSVLQNNGLVNITPKYVDGGASNIHTKQCMFSIENLAWRGYDPYSFEQALSWEQRGPLGGRIMWFPPYGIQFSETTSTQWGTNTFLGRGEDVYTYTNTTRTGTLSFMMVVDHPSILDYVSWTDENNNVTDTDILRFLAGCGEGDGKGLRDAAKPTPLTDEYTQVHDEVYANQQLDAVTATSSEEQTTPDDEKIEDKVLCFYVFYPNNYSGTYDDPQGELRTKYNEPTKVEPIPYLLAGTGAQKNNGEYTKGFEGDIWLTDGKIEGQDEGEWNGNGYEMKGTSGLGKGNGYIAGTSKYPNSGSGDKRRYWTGLNGEGRSKKYSTGLNDPSKCKKWYYRIDGRYTFPQDSALEEKSHYYNQTLKSDSSYVDEKSFGLNNDIEALAKVMSDQIKKDDNGNYVLIENEESEVFTLGEIAYVLYDGNEKKQTKCGIENPETNNRIVRLKEILNVEKIKEIKSITAAGYASAHGYVATNHKLGEHRAQSALHWFMSNLKENISPKTEIGYEPKDGENIGNADANDKKEGDWTTGDESASNAKKWRYAKVQIAFNTAELKTPATANDSDGNKEDNTVKSNGFYFQNAFTDESYKYKPVAKECIKFPKSAIEKFNKDYDMKSIEMKKGEDDNYIFTIDQGNEEEGPINMICTNYNEVYDNESVYVQLVDGETEEEYELIRKFSFGLVDPNDDEKTHSCVIYDCGDVICYAYDDFENIYQTNNKETSGVSDFEFEFVDNKPIYLQDIGTFKLGTGGDMWLYNAMCPNAKIKKINYNANHHDLIINDGYGEKSCKVTNSFYDDDFINLKLSDGCLIKIYKQELTYKDFKYIYISVSSGTSITPLVGTNAYYTEKGSDSNETIVAIHKKKTEIINIAKNSIRMRFKEPKNGSEAAFNEGYPSVTDKCTVKSSGNTYTVKTENHGTILFTLNGDNKIDVSRSMQLGSNLLPFLQMLWNDVEIIKMEDDAVSKSDGEGGDTEKSIAKARRITLLSEDDKGNGATDESSGSSDGGNNTTTNDKEETTYTTKKEPVATAPAERKYVGYDDTGEVGYYQGTKYPIYEDSNKKKWFRVSDKFSKVAKFISVGYASEMNIEPVERYGKNGGDENRVRYDQEYHFFKVLEQKDPVVYGSLMDKIKYFDPAFHSMTPEGFNGRLTFLQQCMRQGNTVGASDGKFAKGANNLAFGRAPYCVLRLGDFYNQMIVIDNLSINYDPLVWDLNVEGVGVQPLIAHVQLSFKFIGGGDLTGPVRRLQNAMSFNYYANARLYDNRADRIERMWSDKTCGAIEHDEIIDVGNTYENLKKEAKNATDADKKADLIKQSKKAKKNEYYGKDKKGNQRSSSFYTTQMYK